MQTIRPRHSAGETSVMYIGHNIQEAPTANPPHTRKKIRAPIFQLSAQPIADTRKSHPASSNPPRRPKRSAITPDTSVPGMAAQNALELVIPSQTSLRWNVARSGALVPEITAVSNPNSNPPNAAAIVLLRSVALSDEVGGGSRVSGDLRDIG